MTQDNEWKQLYNSRYINERVEAELVEFKEEIEKKFKISKCKNYIFPRVTENNDYIKEDKDHKGTIEEKRNDDPILLSKNYVFDYKMDRKDEGKINKKNIDFFQKKQNNEKPPKISMIRTIDVDSKWKQSKSAPRSVNHSKPRKTQHKRQATLFKFDHNDNSCDKAKLFAKTNSSLSVTSHSSNIENLNSKNINNQNTIDEIKLHDTDKKNGQKMQLSQIKFQKAKKNYAKHNLK